MTPAELKKWREDYGYSQGQLARALDVHVMTVSRWERGFREIPSFLHLALECLGTKGTKTKKERRVKMADVRKPGIWGEDVKNLRAAMKFTQLEFAEFIGVPVPYLRRLERGEIDYGTQPPSITLRRLLDCLEPERKREGDI